MLHYQKSLKLQCLFLDKVDFSSLAILITFEINDTIDEFVLFRDVTIFTEIKYLE